MLLSSVCYPVFLLAAAEAANSDSINLPQQTTTLESVR